jgi:hypothetical protein
MPYELPIPELMLLASGTLSFYWCVTTYGFYADVEIIGNGEITYFIKHGNEQYKGGGKL